MARMVVIQLPIIITIKVLNRLFVSKRNDSIVPFTSANRVFISEAQRVNRLAYVVEPGVNLFVGSL